MTLSAFAKIFFFVKNSLLFQDASCICSCLTHISREFSGKNIFAKISAKFFEEILLIYVYFRARFTQKCNKVFLRKFSHKCENDSFCFNSMANQSHHPAQAIQAQYTFHQGGGIHGGAHSAEYGTISGWCSVVYVWKYWCRVFFIFFEKTPVLGVVIVPL